MKRFDLSLEHKVLKALREERLSPGRWLLAVSGGVDSMVLAEILWRWQKHLKIELAAAHVHHGTEGGPARDQAQALVRSWARQHKVRFLSNPARPRALRSEAELRDFRQATLQRWRRVHRYDRIVLAHHRDDLLETRLLRLIRGSGAQGLRAMQLSSGHKLRPLLALTRAEIEAYANVRALRWHEDPSNRETSPLRNWLRQDWLPSLEQKQKGATKSLARSLEILAPVRQDLALSAFVGLRREALQRLSSTRQRAIVAEFLRALGVQGYGSTHVHELLKRLTTSRREFAFEMLGLRFQVTPDLLWASRV